MIIQRLHCPNCDVSVEGRFARAAGATHPEQLEFVEVSALRGEIRHVEKELNVSYPTVRSRLNSDRGARLQCPAHPTPSMIGPEAPPPGAAIWRTNHVGKATKRCAASYRSWPAQHDPAHPRVIGMASRKEILEMLSRGGIDVERATELLARSRRAQARSPPTPPAPGLHRAPRRHSSPRAAHTTVAQPPAAPSRHKTVGSGARCTSTSAADSRHRVLINVPLGLMRFGMRIGALHQ